MAPRRPPNSLAVEGDQRRSLRSHCLEIKDRRHFKMFRITKTSIDWSADVKIPRLVPESTMQGLIGTDLSTNFDKAELIDNFKVYHERKRDTFLECILNNSFFTEVAKGTYKKPDFICFSGCISFPMMTPYLTRFGDWEIYAVKMHDVIYLWGEKPEDSGPDKEAYSSIYFEHILTHNIRTDHIPDQHDQVLVISELKFCQHQLLCLSEIDAQQDNESLVEIKCFKDSSPGAKRAKHIKCWAQSVISGKDFLVIGKRDDKGKLICIQTTTTNDVARELELDTLRCYNFQNELLNWIKSQFIESHEQIVKKISWKTGEPNVSITDAPNKRFLPKWYIEGLKKKE